MQKVCNDIYIRTVLYNDMQLNFPSTYTGGQILVACSGGRDSMALAHVLRTQGYHIGLAYFDHALRAQSISDGQLVHDFAKQLGVPFYTQRKDIAAMGGNIENTARQHRYAFLEDIRKKHGYTWMVTAHHKDDNLESIALALLRKSGHKGKGGIASAKGNILRPLLDTSRQEITTYVHRHDIPYAEDISNKDTRYARNYMRHILLPIMRVRKPNIDTKLLDIAASSQKSLQALHNEIQKCWDISLSTLLKSSISNEAKIFYISRTLSLYDSQSKKFLDRVFAAKPGDGIPCRGHFYKRKASGIIREHKMLVVFESSLNANGAKEKLLHIKKDHHAVQVAILGFDKTKRSEYIAAGVASRVWLCSNYQEVQKLSKRLFCDTVYYV